MLRGDSTGGLGVWLGASLVFGACFQGGFVQGLACESDADCGPQLRCVKEAGATEGLCDGRGDNGLCGNGLLDAGEECDDGDLEELDGCTPMCRTPVCGDGFMAEGEACDDGNRADGDGCEADCRLPGVCGNGLLEAAEECDDGNAVDTDACTSKCRTAACGDGFQRAGEACDDGNTDEHDECTPACLLPACGDGFVGPGEACDDGNGVETDACTSVCTESPEVPQLKLELAQVKQFQFSWTARGAAYYKLYERKNAGEEFALVDGDIQGESYSLTVSLHLRVNASYRLEACNTLDHCVLSEVLDVAGTLVEAIGYVKASNTNELDQFGTSVALSADGETLAVGASGEDSDATGIDGDEKNNELPDSGAVYVFVRSGQTWIQQAYVKASDADESDRFGSSVALSGDGDTLAVGAKWEDSAATGINNDQANDDATASGAVYVFVRSGQTWIQQAYVKASNTADEDAFGYSVALSGDGDTLAVGAWEEDSAATGINNDQANDDELEAGAVYVFVRSGQTWSQQAYVKASNTEKKDRFGCSVALSGDGDTLAVGAYGESSVAKGINSDQANNDAPQAGAVYVFVRSGQNWAQQAYVKASNTDFGDAFGSCVALSGDGDTLAVGAESAGAVYVFVRSGQNWAQQAYVKASNTEALDQFGYSVALSSDGDTLAVGASGEDSAATGINNGEDGNSAADAGAVYVFVRSGTEWLQRARVKAANTSADDGFGQATALSGDGETLAVGATLENYKHYFNEPNAPAFDSGAVYLY